MTLPSRDWVAGVAPAQWALSHNPQKAPAMELKFKLIKMDLQTLEIETPQAVLKMLAAQLVLEDGQGRNQTLDRFALTPRDALTLIAQLQAALDHMEGKPPQIDPSQRH